MFTKVSKVVETSTIRLSCSTCWCEYCLFQPKKITIKTKTHIYLFYQKIMPGKVEYRIGMVNERWWFTNTLNFALKVSITLKCCFVNPIPVMFCQIRAVAVFPFFFTSFSCIVLVSFCVYSPPGGSLIPICVCSPYAQHELAWFHFLWTRLYSFLCSSPV